jgi:UDP-2,3-diacylglucosamine pyrophosphatase LpxH
MKLNIEASAMRTLIIGDTHLGSPLCRTGLLIKLLTEVPFDRLILNGDIFDDLNFRRFGKNHWKVLAVIRHLVDTREVVWIHGNHDGPAGFFGQLLGVRVRPDFSFGFRDGQVFVAHGDEFDDFQNSVKGLRNLRDKFYGFAIWFDVPRKTAIQWAQRSTKVFARAREKVKRKAVQKGIKLGARWVVVGHTHHREEEELQGVTYMNPSSWLTHNPSYVLFDDDLEQPQMVVMGHERRKAIARVRTRVRRAGRTLARRLRE